jgi:hypothetical protein
MRRALLGLLALLATAPAFAAEPLAVLGLRSGMSRTEIEAAYPDMLLSEVPYVDPQIGEAYRTLYGGLATLRIDGSAVLQREALEASLQVTLTGDRALYRAQANLREEGTSCEEALAGLMERHGRPALNDGIAYTLWREADILYATRLEFRCLDPARGLYSLALDDPFRERLFQKSLGRRLIPTIEAMLLVLGDQGRPARPLQLGRANVLIR